jgi:hypothetical protein
VLPPVPDVLYYVSLNFFSVVYDGHLLLRGIVDVNVPRSYCVAMYIAHTRLECGLKLSII